MLKVIVAVAAVVTILALVGVASASSTHFKKGSPVFHDTQIGTSATSADEGKITASGDIAGLGNGNVLISIDVTPANVGTPVTGSVFSCSNPGINGTQAAGVNPATISGSLAIPDSKIKNGTLHFSVSTLTTVSPPAGCPGSNWSEEVDALSASSVTLTIQQAGVTVLGGTACTPSPNPTTNNADFTCITP